MSSHHHPPRSNTEDLSTDTSINNGFDNSSRVTAQSKPPTYASIFPEKAAKNAYAAKSSRFNLLNKILKPTSSNPSNQVTATNNQLAVQHLPRSVSNESNMQPISYEELFQSTTNVTTGGTANSLQFQNSQYPQSQQPLQPSPTHRNNRQNKLAKQFQVLFKQSYYLKHFIIITAASFSLISLQIILTSNESLLSSYFVSVWVGLSNLFLLLLSIYTLKFAKIWLLLVTILVHFACLLFILCGLVLLNVLVLVVYSGCPNKYYESLFGPYDCSTSNMKYINEMIIFIGIICLIMFTYFMAKLIKAFKLSKPLDGE